MTNQHLDDVRALVRIWLERHLLLYSQRYHRTDAGYSDLYVDRAEVDAFLAGRLGSGEPVESALQTLAEREIRVRNAMAGRMEKAAESGRPTPVADLRAAFDIRDDRVMDVVMALMAGELDGDFARAFSHAWCDFTKKEADIGFLIELVSRTPEDQDRLRAFFLAGDHPVFRYLVLEVAPGRSDRQMPPFVMRPVRLADRIVRFLCGETQPPSSITGTRGGLAGNEGNLDDVLLPAEVKTAFLDAFRRGLAQGSNHTRILLWGPPGTGKRSLAVAGATASGQSCLAGDARDILEDPTLAEARLTAFLREARLHRAVPFLAGVDAWGETAAHEGTDPRHKALEQVSRLDPGPWILSSGRRMPELSEALPGMVSVKVPHPTPDVQRLLWSRLLASHSRFTRGFGIDAIVERYSMTGGAIARVAASLTGSGADLSGLGPTDVYPVIRDHLAHRLGTVAVPIARGRTWDDLIVPKRTSDLLREMVAFVRNRERILETWGFGTLAGPAGGVTALFHGPPGTGKTLAASILSTELGLEAFQVDLARVVDKYVGETEKNLARVFDEGSRAQAVLLFDEADSLFSKRTGVKSAVDRYANLEVNFLLQRMETYEGVCILTSNYPEAIDEAFKRRLRFKVEFPHPDCEDRVRIWRCMMPSQAPLAGNVRFEELAERYEMTGAHIRNVALRAAALAAEEDDVITLAHLVRAANREYAEMGKLVRDEDWDGPGERDD